MTKLTVRVANEKDLSDLVDMYLEYDKFFKDWCNDSKTLDRNDIEKRLYRIMFSKETFTRAIIAKYDTGPIGMIPFHKSFTPDYHCVQFEMPMAYINPKHRGFGYILFNKLTEIAHQENIKQLKWCVWGQNAYAKKLYQKMGAKSFAETDDEHWMYLDI